MKLTDPFDVSELHTKIQASNKAKTKGLAVLYVDARNVMNRLDEVVGSMNWKTSYRVLRDTGKQIDVECTLTVAMDGALTEKADTGEGEDYKTAYSDSFKRAAVHYGVARYLYESGQHWFDTEMKGQTQVFVKPKDEIIATILKRMGVKSKPEESPAREPESKPTPVDSKLLEKASRDIEVPEGEEELEKWIDTKRKRLFAFCREEFNVSGDVAKVRIKEICDTTISTNMILIHPEMLKKINLYMLNKTGKVLF